VPGAGQIRAKEILNMNTRERLLEDIEKDRERLDKRVQTLNILPIEEIEAAFPEGYFSHITGCAYDFDLPWDFKLIQKVKDFVAQHSDWRISWENQKAWNEKDASHWFTVYIDKEYHQIDFNFKTKIAGTTCAIQQIGFEQKPVFEVVCGEGAAEPTFSE
jgi:hypothetical protein